MSQKRSAVVSRYRAAKSYDCPFSGQVGHRHCTMIQRRNGSWRKADPSQLESPRPKIRR